MLVVSCYGLVGGRGHPGLRSIATIQPPPRVRIRPDTQPGRRQRSTATIGIGKLATARGQPGCVGRTGESLPAGNGAGADHAGYLLPLPTLDADATVLDIFPADRPDPAAPLFPPTGELWTSSRFLESDRAGGDQRLAFSSKKPDEDEPLTLGLNNGSGIGPEYLLIKNEDTTFLGRVAGRYCEVHPGLSEEDRVSEVLFRCEFEHRLSRCNKLFSAVEYACDPADPGSRTLRTQAAWEVLLDPQETLSLRTAVLESSTYAPNREQTKTLDYTLDLSWKF